MVVSTASISAAAVLSVGALVFWSNPYRLLNRLFLTLSAHVAAWLTCVHFALTLGEDPFWIHAASAVASFVPGHMWLLKLIYANGGAPRRKAEYFPILNWFGGGALLVAISCSQWYLRASAVGTPAQFGAGSLLYIVLSVAMYLVVARQTIVEIRRSAGATRLELQILLLGICVAALVILSLMAVRATTRATWPIHFQPIALLAVYTGTLVLVTTRRIFNARQIAMWSLEKLAVIAAAATALFATEEVCQWFRLSSSLALVIVVVATIGVLLVSDRILQKSFRFFPQAGDARRAVHDVSQRELRWDQLEKSFQSILRGWGQSENAVVLCGPRTVLLTARPALRDGTVLDALTKMHWATPERLARERPSPLRNALRDFLRTEGLGVAVLVAGPTQVALVGVGVSGSRMPFTYPQVTQLLEIASIMGGAFERAHLTAKVQHSEQLAMVGMVGASLAHEIRNPLVAIRTFVQMLPRQHQNPEFRKKFFHVVDEEVQRIEQLARQFLELSAPREFKPGVVNLHTVIAAGLELVSPKAAQRGIRVLSQLQAEPDAAFTDPAAAKQVLLNLCLNAIQALDSTTSDRREVVVVTRNIGTRLEMAVSDTGPGIAASVQARLFEPFQTTKASGFGLGLAVCSDTLAKLGATISVDPPIPNRGATFRVAFPTAATLA